MNGWERWGKRMLKAFLWAPLLIGLAFWLSIPVTWQLIVLVVACGLWDRILEEIWPTPSHTSGQRNG